METLLHDSRYSVRMLAKAPGFALVAILTLTLGIGANAAIFQLIDAVRLPVKDPNTLAIVHLNRNHWGSGHFNSVYSEFSFPLWQQIRQGQGAFSSIAVWGPGRLNLATGGEVKNSNAIWVSGDFFRVLGVPPFLGRLVSDADDQTGCSGGVDLSYARRRRNDRRQILRKNSAA
jgi:putative ABC transport system permease protein